MFFAHPGLPLLRHLRGGLRAALVGALFGRVVALRGVLVVELLGAGGAVSGIRRVQDVALLVGVVHVVGGDVVVRFERRYHISTVDHSALTHVVPLSVFGEQQGRVFVFVGRR